MKQISLFIIIVLLMGCNKPTDNKLNYIIPQPAEVVISNGEFILSELISINCDDEFEYVKSILNDELSKIEGVYLSGKAKKKINITKLKEGDDLGDEGYILDIKPNTITISGNAYGGVFYGIQTLLQFISIGADSTIPCGRITDKPKYKWRGFMLDVARYFYTKAEMLKFIDLISFYKINKFHIHLTDDQGWRIAIDSYPRLTTIGSIQAVEDSIEGGFYSKADMREIIEYARIRNVSIIPEIDLPGHSQASIAAYPELSCFGNRVKVRSLKHRKPNLIDGSPFSDPLCVGKEDNYEFLEKVIKEIAELFPSEYIHLGGDECSTGAWEFCELCQKKKEDEGLKDEHELQGYFMKRVEDIVRSHGKIAIGWDEVYETNVPRTFAVMAWRDDYWGVEAANNGYQVIMAPSQYYYYNRQQSELSERYYGVITTLSSMYNYQTVYNEIIPKNRDNVLGLESCFWGGGEWNDAMNYIFPRFLVFSEQCWSSKQKDLDDFVHRMSFQYKVLDNKDVNYYVQHPNGLHDDVCYTDEYTVNLSLPINSAEIRFTLDGSEPIKESALFIEAFNVPIGTVIRAKTFLPNGRSSITVEGTSRKVYLQPATKVKEVKKGVNLIISKGIIETTTNFDSLPEIYSGITNKIAYPDDSLQHDFAMRFSGYINIPKNGVYSFFSTSSDGTNFYIDGKLCLSNDFKHPKLTFTKRIALDRGFHKIQVDYFHNSIFEKFFMFEIAGEGMERQEVSREMLFH